MNSCTLTGNSAAKDGGGAYDSTLNHCSLIGNTSTSSGGGAYYGTLNNCILNGNSAGTGAGACYATLNNCTLSANTSASFGGGSYNGTLNNCIVTKNSAKQGGGASGGTLSNCILSGNSASDSGGGSYISTLNNCKLIGNSAKSNGGGAYYGTLVNCALSGNSVTGIQSSFQYSLGGGGGSYFSALTNCTLIGNTSSFTGGGSRYGTLNNCILYYNRAPDSANWSGGMLNSCCTTPPPSSGSGNIPAEPQMASTSHLSAGSPCRGAGSAADASGVDIDGEAWLSPPSIGCDEYHSGSVTGTLSVAVAASYTNAAAGFEVEFQGLISGEASASRWEFDDGTIVSNRPYASRAWMEAGEYAVVLKAYNDSNPSGVTATAVVQVVEQPVHHVSLSSASPVAPYSTWATAATNIQDAVDSASVIGALVLVSNGVYETGGRVVDGAMTNRVVVSKPLTVQSVNGPDVTAIVGYQMPGTTNGDKAVRCVYLGNGVVLSGFTLTNGATRTSGSIEQEQSGGGVFCTSAEATVTNCVVSGNASYACGGGTWYGTLKNCIVRGNASSLSGGGSFAGTLHNCVLTGNSASSGGGGAFEGTLNNCVISDNSATKGGGVASTTTLNNCTLTGNSASSWGGGAYVDSTLNNCIVYYNHAPDGPNWTAGTFNYCCTTPLPSSGTGNITNTPLFVDLDGGDLHLQPGSPCINAGNNAYVLDPVDMDGNPRIVGGTVDMGAYESSVIPPVPPEFTSCLWLTNAVQLQFTGEIGKVFEVQGSTNLTDWVPLATLTNVSGQVLYTDPAVTNHPSRFYRAVQLP